MIVNTDLQNSCKPRKDHNNLSTKVFSPFFSLAGKDWWSLFNYSEWLMARKFCKKNGLLKLFAALFHKALVFILWFWALIVTRDVLGFPLLPFLFANTAI